MPCMTPERFRQWRLSPEETRERLPDGRLRFSSGNIAIHMINRQFVEKLTTREDFKLPYHIAVKDIEALAADGTAAAKIKGIKFEMFIFDALGFAGRSVTLEVSREEEFSPVKNASGSDSPRTARAAMSALHRRWLESTGRAASIPSDAVVEISPLYALDADEFRGRFTPPAQVPETVYIE